jgi:ADP-ribosyl-[dinitrogen reductase] hydrolase
MEQLFLLHTLTFPYTLLFFEDRYTLLVIFILTEARVVGGLVGIAIGDALGAPFESLPPLARPVREMTGGGPHGRKKGGITDDTLQALAVARSLVSSHGFDPADLIPRLLRGYLEHPAFYGPTSREVFEKILHGVPSEHAAHLVHQNQGSRSNGSVMRGPPLGMYFREPRTVRDVSLACSRLTHLDVVAGECSVVMNVMVSRLCRGASRQNALHTALSFCADVEVVGMLSRYWQFDPDPSLDPLLSIHAALSFFLTARSFENALIEAVQRGGDADTVGALCGALCGAHWGVEKIPPRWMADLECAEQIKEVAYQLWRVAEW